MATLDLRNDGKVLIITFKASNRHNPFSQAMMQEIAKTLQLADSDSSINSVVLYGGTNRSFSAGGDFKEVSHFAGGDEVDTWIDNLTNLYLSAVELRKPIIAAIDGYAIGAGLQIALTCDYRIGSLDCQLALPEFELGIACSFGTFMLTHAVGRAAMQELVFGCEKIDATRGREIGLLHEIVDSELLLERALNLGHKFAGYSPSAVQSTKPHANASFAAGLREICEHAKRAHRDAFSARVAQPKMSQIISRSSTTTKE